MSASEATPQPKGVDTAVRFLVGVWRLFLRSWAVYRESRLGIAGLVIVGIFGAVAILAPFISPYSREFAAPESDRFHIAQYPQQLTQLANLDFNPPVSGPTTPTSTAKQGGMWMINSAQQGFIFMDFLRAVLETNLTPYQRGNLSLTLDITQDFLYGSLPRPTGTLTAVYYIVPAENKSRQHGGGQTDGALAFFAGRDFFVVDPFSKAVLFHSRLDFDPQWTGQDPGSAGDLLWLPREQEICDIPSGCFIGQPQREVAPHRYFFAASVGRTVVFEIDYINAIDSNPAPGGRVVLNRNVTLSASPFVFYSDKVDKYEDFRAGRGQGILLPLANGTLEVRNVTGAIRVWVPLRLGGEPATATGPIGYTRSTDDILGFYIPLRSASSVGLATFDLRVLRIVSELALPNPSWTPVGTATSFLGTDIYFALFDPAGSGTTHLIRMNRTGAEVTRFRQSFPGQVRTFFEVDQVSNIFVVAENSRISTMKTVSGDAAVRPQLFALVPPPNATFFAYAGALAGTLYGLQITQEELNAFWLEPASARAVVFQLVGTSRTPLGPGTYPSGNNYLLGTDAFGRDILTQLFWGTQVAFIVGVLAAAFAVGLGTLIGLIAGYYGRLVDTLLMRMTDIFLVLPFLPVVLVLAEILRPSIWVIILVIGIVGWPGIARVIRAQTLTLKERPFVDAARVTGASDFRVIFSHIAPNVLPFSFLFMTLGVAGAIVTEAFLSYLGLGDATVTSWGGMLSDVLTFGGALSAWWWLLPPGLTITLLSLGFYLLGRGFDEIVNPRLRRR